MLITSCLYFTLFIPRLKAKIQVLNKIKKRSHAIDVYWGLELKNSFILKVLGLWHVSYVFLVNVYSAVNFKIFWYFFKACHFKNYPFTFLCVYLFLFSLQSEELISKWDPCGPRPHPQLCRKFLSVCLDKQATMLLFLALGYPLSTWIRFWKHPVSFLESILASLILNSSFTNYLLKEVAFQIIQ